jgi:ParB family chromosome partitioning protein
MGRSALAKGACAALFVLRASQFTQQLAIGNQAMKLDHLPLEQLKLSPLNVRRKGGKDIADLLPMIRRHGIIQPLLVRPNCEGFEIIAGQRRYNSLLALAGEGIAEPVPCIIMEDGDDARAVEASLVENIGHLPMDEIDQFKAFAGLIQKGMTAADISA